MSTYTYPLAYQIEDEQLLRKACYAEGDNQYGDYLLSTIKQLKSDLTQSNRINWIAQHN